jgi:N-acetylmuramoyl-L-alanine amidase
MPQHHPTTIPDRPTIILDPGHGRGDPGAVHHTPTGVDLIEADSNLSIAEHMRDSLEEMGYDVYLTRSGYGRPLGSKLDRLLISDDLMARVRLAAAVSGDLFISIHSNGSPNPAHSGVEIWYCGQHAFGAQSGRLANMMLDAAMRGLSEFGYEATRRSAQGTRKVHRSEGFCQFLVTRSCPPPSSLNCSSSRTMPTRPFSKMIAPDRPARQLAEAIDVFVQKQHRRPTMTLLVDKHDP